MTLQTTNPTWSPERSLAIRVHLERASDATSPPSVRTMQLIYALELTAIARHEITHESLATKLTMLAYWLRAGIQGELWRLPRMMELLAEIDADSEMIALHQELAKAAAPISSRLPKR